MLAVIAIDLSSLPWFTIRIKIAANILVIFSSNKSFKDLQHLYSLIIETLV